LPPHVLNDPHRIARVQRLNPSWRVDPKYKAYPFPVDSRMTLGTRIIISDKKIRRVSLLPTYVNEDSSPRFLSRKDKEFSDVVSYMERITQAQRMNTQYKIEGDEVVVID
jgi:hypothetical protein